MIPVKKVFKTFYSIDKTQKIEICSRQDTDGYTFIHSIYEPDKKVWRRLMGYMGVFETIEQAESEAKNWGRIWSEAPSQNNGVQ